MSKSLPYLALLVGVLVLSLSTLFIRWAEAPGMVTSFYRMAVATLAVAPFFVRHWRSRPAAERSLDLQWRTKKGATASVATAIR